MAYTVLLYILLFFAGAAIGSFLSVIIFRFGHDQTIQGRSHCSYCKKKLSAVDLFPLISYLALKGRCRYCKKNISPTYIFLEVVTGVAMLLTVITNPSLAGVINGIVVASLLLIVVLDTRFFIISDKALLVIGGLAIIKSIYLHQSVLLPTITGLLLGLIFVILYVVSKGKWVGFGDAKISFVVGLLLGYPLGMVTFVVSVWFGALWGMVLITLKRGSLKTALPFGAFLAILSIIALLFSRQLQFLNYIF